MQKIKVFGVFFFLVLASFSFGQQDNVLPCDSVFVPNSFTARNGDQIYSCFKIETFCAFDSFEFQLFNRWGSVIFETDDQHFEWYGKHMKSNEPVASGTYFFLLNFEVNGEKHTKNGYFHIL